MVQAALVGLCFPTNGQVAEDGRQTAKVAQLNAEGQSRCSAKVKHVAAQSSDASILARMIIPLL